MLNRREVIKHASALPFCGFLAGETVRKRESNRTIEEFIENKMNWYPYQRKMLKIFANTDKNIIFKHFTNGGFTTMVTTYAAYEAAVNGKKIGIFSRFGLDNIHFILGHSRSSCMWEFKSGGYIRAYSYGYGGFNEPKEDLDICIYDDFGNAGANGSTTEIIDKTYSIKQRVILYSNVGHPNINFGAAFKILYENAYTKSNDFFDLIEVNYLDNPIHGIDELRKKNCSCYWNRYYMCNLNWFSNEHLCGHVMGEHND